MIVLEYFINASEEYVEEEGGEALLSIVYANELSGRQEIFLSQGEVKKIGNYSFAFESEFEGEGMLISRKDQDLVLVATDTIQHMDMVQWPPLSNLEAGHKQLAHRQLDQPLYREGQRQKQTVVRF